MNILTWRQTIFAVLTWPVRVIAFEVKWVRLYKTPLFSYFSPLWPLVTLTAGVGVALLSSKLSSVAYELGFSLYDPVQHAPGLQLSLLALPYILGVGLYYVRTLAREDARELQWGHFLLLGAMAGSLLTLL